MNNRIVPIDEVTAAFAAQQPDFIQTLRGCQIGKLLANFADQWKSDTRPWAREQMLLYLREPWDRAGHQPLIKRLFKWAEQQRDTELLSIFALGCDLLVRRQRKKRHHYDWQTRTSWTSEELVAPRHVLPATGRTMNQYDPKTGTKQSVYWPSHKLARMFKYRTRYYLRRRSWRFYRKLAYQQPAEYVPAVTQLLLLYRDEHLRNGEDLLECWSLIHALYRQSPLFKFGVHRIQLLPQQQLSTLQAAPFRLDLWSEPVARDSLLTLVLQAQAQLVRIAAVELLRAHHVTGPLPSLQVIEELLHHTDLPVQQLGQDYLEQYTSKNQLTLNQWLDLLKIDQPQIQSQLCQLMQKQVPVASISAQQAIELACSVAYPIAGLGWNYLQQMPWSTAQQRAQLADLTNLRCAALGASLTQWLLAKTARGDNYDREILSACCDHRLPEVRQAAWDFLRQTSPACDDATLFTRLLETPYPELRLQLIDELRRRSRLPGQGSSQLVSLWSSVLLGVEQGGRQKLTATAQLAQAMAAEPELTPQLLPVLVVAVRSLRRPEMRAGLTAVLQLLEQRPDLQPQLLSALPELELSPTS
jgi:hypothetical protein